MFNVQFPVPLHKVSLSLLITWRNSKFEHFSCLLQFTVPPGINRSVVVGEIQSGLMIDDLTTTESKTKSLTSSSNSAAPSNDDSKAHRSATNRASDHKRRLCQVDVQQVSAIAMWGFRFSCFPFAVRSAATYQQLPPKLVSVTSYCDH